VDDLTGQYKQELKNAKMEESELVTKESGMEFMLGPQLSSTCAIVGSVMGQEAIKAISQNDAPLKNLFLYSALDTSGIVCNYPPS